MVKGAHPSLYISDEGLAALVTYKDVNMVVQRQGEDASPESLQGNQDALIHAIFTVKRDNPRRGVSVLDAMDLVGAVPRLNRRILKEEQRRRGQ
ncbi:MAG TPA: hypothetical protein VEW42_03885 [Candidatus Eisenbacteria bacterium]|nr:hypothetical protein [Candidatus Eisenbacteria bacterium]